MEVLVGLVIAAVVVGLGVGLVTSWTQASRSLPRVAARGASDAQVQHMVAELRNAVAVSYIAPTEVIAIVNTAGNTPTAPSVGGTPTGTYQVAYYYSNAVLYRNGGGRASFGATN